MQTFNVTASPKLEAYRLNKRLLGLLQRYQRLAQYAEAAARPLPRFIRLYRRDFLEIDSIVSAQSDKKFNASTVTWCGLPLKSSDE